MQILKSTKVIFVLIGFLFTCNFLQAENDQKMKAVHELFEAMDTKNNFDKTIVKMIDVQIQQQPQIKIFRKTMLKFMNKYMGWESLKEDMAKIYTSKFTLQELIELKQFYKSPVGRKSVILFPELASEGAALGQKRVNQNIEELKRMI